jgi:hypothetical protein
MAVHVPDILDVSCHAVEELTWAAAAVGYRLAIASGGGRVPWLRCRRDCRRFRWLESTVRLPVLLGSGRPKEAEECRESRPQRTLQRDYVMPKPVSAHRCHLRPCSRIRVAAAQRWTSSATLTCQLANHTQVAHREPGALQRVEHRSAN